MFGGGGEWDYHSDQEEEGHDEDVSARQALIIAVSATPDMFRPWGENDEKPILASLKICDSILRTKIISNPKDKVGILFFGTEHAKKSSSFDNLYILQELKNITTEGISDLHKMISSYDLDGFEDKIGSSTQYDLKNLFWLAKIMFDERDAKNMAKKLMLITNEDDPHADNANLKQDAIQKFKDLGKLDFGLITFKEAFDWDKFYKKIWDDESALTCATDMDSLLKIVRMKQRLKRPITRSTLELAPEIKCAVGVYSLIRPAAKPKQVKVNKRTNEPVQKETITVNAATGQPLLKSETKKVIEVGGETATFTQAELKDMKYNFDTGISIIGFLDKEKFDPFSWYRSPGYFIYPDDERISGSKDIFTSLLRRCDARKKIALVKFVLTRGANPKIGCLLPCIEKHSKSVISFPQGFFLAVIPFSGDIRELEIPEHAPASQTLVDRMETLVKRLTQKNFDVSQAHNPYLHAVWKEIENAALNLPRDDEEFLDFTQPNLALMQERAGQIMCEINNQTRDLQYQPKEKKARTSKAPVSFDMENEYRNNRLEKLTVASLKAFAEDKNIVVPWRGRFPPTKDSYVRAIKEYFSE